MTRFSVRFLAAVALLPLPLLLLELGCAHSKPVFYPNGGTTAQAAPRGGMVVEKNPPPRAANPTGPRTRIEVGGNDPDR
jgi:hypothetical protein